MAIYKRGKNWWYNCKDANGNRIQRSTGTSNREDAERIYAEIIQEQWEVKRTGKKVKRTWQEAVVRFVKEKGHKKSLKTDINRLKYLHTHLHDKYLDQVTLDVVNQVRTAYLNTGVRHSTANRMLALIRTILRCAKNDWEWVDKIPNIKLMAEPKRRVRWLKPEETKALLDELPEHLRVMAEFSIATGLRETNVTQLKWEQIDMQRRCAWIHADEFKTGKPLSVPLNQMAIALLRSQMGKHLVYVFTFNGEPVTRANNRAWRKALKRAGIEDFRWHDLRHCFATNHIMNGTPLNTLQELGGWKSVEMVRRYAHLSSDHLAGYADNSVTFLLHKGSDKS